MSITPIENFNPYLCHDQDIIKAWHWFMSFISEHDWKKRKEEIEKKILVEFKPTDPFSESLTRGTLLAVKDDVIGWYLYLIDMYINEPHKYEYFQGARIVPIFKRFGVDLEKLKGIRGIEKRIKDLVKKRRSEADSLLFEILTALLWVRNGYEVEFLEEKNVGKTPDIIAKKDGDIWHIECKRQSKTSDYTYRETVKRQKMIAHISKILMEGNILLDILFHVELETLPDTFLFDLLKDKLKSARKGKIISNKQVDITLDFVDVPSIKNHLKTHDVKFPSPTLNYLIGKNPSDYKAFTSSVSAEFVRYGDGEISNLYISNIENAFGVFWSCDAKETLFAKARDIKTYIKKATEQFESNVKSIIHIGMETFDGPKVEKERLVKIKNTIEKIDVTSTSLRWIFCHFFQSYSTLDEEWVFDETISLMSSYQNQPPPIENHFLIIPDDVDIKNNMSHWERPLP